VCACRYSRVFRSFCRCCRRSRHHVRGSDLCPYLISRFSTRSYSPAYFQKLLLFYFVSFMIMTSLPRSSRFSLERRRPRDSRGPTGCSPKCPSSASLTASCYSVVLFRTVKRALDCLPFNWDKAEPRLRRQVCPSLLTQNCLSSRQTALPSPDPSPSGSATYRPYRELPAASHPLHSQSGSALIERSHASLAQKARAEQSAAHCDHPQGHHGGGNGGGHASGHGSRGPTHEAIQEAGVPSPTDFPS